MFGQPLQSDDVESAIKSYPYHVSVQDALKHFCSGSIISERFVLSAAVCFPKNTESTLNLIVHAGSSSTSGSGSVHRVSRVIRHENYSYSDEFSTSKNNLALVELEDPIVFDENHQPIELFDENEKVQSKSSGVISGWPMNDKETRPKQLLTAKVDIVDRQNCNNAYSEFHQILENEICAAKDNFKNLDLGSPLVINGRLAGVGSWDVAGYSGLDSPKVFTNVAYYRDWINKHAQL